MSKPRAPLFPALNVSMLSRTAERLFIQPAVRSSSFRLKVAYACLTVGADRADAAIRVIVRRKVGVRSHSPFDNEKGLAKVGRACLDRRIEVCERPQFALWHRRNIEPRRHRCKPEDLVLACRKSRTFPHIPHIERRRRRRLLKKYDCRVFRDPVGEEVGDQRGDDGCCRGWAGGLCGVGGAAAGGCKDGERDAHPSSRCCASFYEYAGWAVWRIERGEETDKTGRGIWVSWYKKAAKLPTEITEDTIREAAFPLGLVDVKVCAVMRSGRV